MYLTTLDLTKYTTLGSADYPAYTLFDSISEVIRQRLSPESAAVLAEPIFDNYSNEIDYMAAKEGKALLLDDLPTDKRNSALEKLAGYADEIRALADTYAKSDNPQAKRIGQNLQYAIYVPDSANIYVVNGEPVLSGWGLKLRTGVAPFDTTQSRSLKTGVDPTPQQKTESTERVIESAPPPVAPPSKTIQGKPKGTLWPYWLLGFFGLLLFLLLLGWLFTGDKQRTSNSNVAQSPVQDTRAPEQSLPGSFDQAASEGGSDSNVSLSVADRAPSGAPSGAQKAESVSQPQVPPGESTNVFVIDPQDSLFIPQSSIERGDLQFLFGDWVSVTDLISTETKEPIRIFYSFDNSGSGTTTIERSGQDSCTAPVKAEFRESSQLHIRDQFDVMCPDGVYFPASIVVCDVDQDGRAVCVGEQTDNQYNVTLKRSVLNQPASPQRTDGVLKKVLGEVNNENHNVDIPVGAISIPVANRPTSNPPYNRDYFGRGWGDDDQDCQNTRQEILITLSTSPVRFTNESRCTVLSGKWISPFTNAVHYTTKNLEVDHQVPLKWAWDHGAYNWDAETRYKFANDPVNLLPVEASLNRSKGALGLEWMPPENQCAYVARFIRIVKLYDMSFFPQEAEIAKNLWKKCQRP